MEKNIRLFKKNCQDPVIENLEVAKSFSSRLKGLLGRKDMKHSHALWIKNCRSIHTFFMQFGIDAIFIDKNMTVQKICTHIPPGTLRWGNYKSKDVIEMTEGLSKKLQICIGDQFYVGY